MDDMDFLDAVLSADKFGWISKPKPKTKAVKATDLDDFMEINEFYREYKKLPSENGDMVELKLFFDVLIYFVLLISFRSELSSSTAISI